MSTIYGIALKKVLDGAKFSINLKTKSLRIDRKFLIKQGEFEGELGYPHSENTLDDMVKLYTRYNHSVPSERSESKRNCYFSALPEEKLTDEDMMYGEPRDISQFKLEFYVLCATLTEALKWDEIAQNKWFWQHSTEKGFILLKEWITK